jgi:hypothetical protein
MDGTRIVTDEPLTGRPVEGAAMDGRFHLDRRCAALQLGGGPGEGERVARFVEAMVRVVEYPFETHRGRVFAPMDDFLYLGPQGAERPSEGAVHAAVRRFTETTNLSIHPTIRGISLDDRDATALFSGSCLYVPPGDATRRGHARLHLRWKSGIGSADGTRPDYRAEFDICIPNGASGIPAAFYVDQDRLCFGTGPHWPVRPILRAIHDDAAEREVRNAALENEAEGLLAPGFAFFLRPRAGGEAAIVEFGNASAEEREGRAWQALVAGRLPRSKSLQDGRSPGVGGWFDVPLEGACLTQDAQNNHKARATLRLVPDESVGRLRARPPGRADAPIALEIVGLLLPAPSGPQAGPVIETIVHLTTEGTLLGSPLARHGASLRCFGRGMRGLHVATILPGDASVAELAVAAPVATRGLALELLGPNRETDFERRRSDADLVQTVRGLRRRLPGGKVILLTRASETGHGLGWIAPGPMSRAVAYVRPTDGRPTDEALPIDWLDCAVRLLRPGTARGREGDPALLGYARDLQAGHDGGDPIRLLADAVAGLARDRAGLTEVPAHPNGVAILGPLIVRAHRPKDGAQ